MCKKYCTAGQATWQYGACWIPKATNTHTQNMWYLLLFHYNNGCTNTPQCYVVRTLPVLCEVVSFTQLPCSRTSDEGPLSCHKQLTTTTGSYIWISSRMIELFRCTGNTFICTYESCVENRSVWISLKIMTFESFFLGRLTFSLSLPHVLSRTWVATCRWNDCPLPPFRVHWIACSSYTLSSSR